MKITGLFAVLTACLALSISYFQSLKREYRCMLGLCSGIRCIRSELSLRLSPLRDLLLLASERTEKDAKAFFRKIYALMDDLDERCFSELWKEACRSTLDMLSEDNRLLIDELGQSLGRFELQDQLSACDRCLNRMENWIESTRQRLPEQRRLALGLGAAVGSFLCLLMM